MAQAAVTSSSTRLEGQVRPFLLLIGVKSLLMYTMLRRPELQGGSPSMREGMMSRAVTRGVSDGAHWPDIICQLIELCASFVIFDLVRQESHKW